MASWVLGGDITLHTPSASPRKIQWPSELLAQLTPRLNAPASHETFQRLARELDDSFGNDTLCLAFHHNWCMQLKAQIGKGQENGLLAWLKANPLQLNPTLLLEQWGTLGHPWHPNYKTKLGLSASQVIALSPEFQARISITLCALHRQYAHIEAMPGIGDHWEWWETNFAHAAVRLRSELQRRDLNEKDYVPLPAHPWQLNHELKRSFTDEIADNLLVVTKIIAFTGHPTMSFRTVLPEGSATAPMIKLPIALRLTSVQRTLSPRSVRMGPRISHLLQRILQQEPSIKALLNVVPERIGVHYAAQPADDQRSRHLGVLYRDNPLDLLQAGEMAVPVGSLFVLDDLQRPLLQQWVKLAQGHDDDQAMLAFFQKYLGIAVPGLLGIYLLYGVAFEAHQQNSFMVMSPDGQPNHLLLRDFGDIRIDRNTLHDQGLDVRLHDPQLTLFDESELVRDKLLHSTFMCHLGELVLLCARHWSVPESLLWSQLATQVSSCFEALRPRVDPERWERERLALLEHDWPAKSFMRMRLFNSATDIVGRIRNPLSCAENAS
ncbi:Aerobactin synthase [compost metagenome]